MNLPKTGSMLRKLLIIAPVVLVLALTSISLFLPARQVTITGIGRLSFETTVTLSVGSEVAYASPGWLSGWAKRVKLTIDAGDIDSDLSDFPILVYLSTSSGREPDDVTFVFDEVGSSSNKIAVTTSDGTTECFVEIERWDDANEEAWLWVNVPSILDTTDTGLYLYYDSTHADNTDYVGDSGSRPEVWSNGFAGVWHLCETTGGSGAIKDSTANANDGTDSGSPTFGAAGQIDNCINFDGTDDYIAVPSSASLKLGSGLTIEAWINIDTWGNWKDIVFKGGGAANNSDYQFALVTESGGGLAWDGTLAGNWRSKYFLTTQDTGEWIYAVVTHDTSTVKCYRADLEISSQADAGAIYESDYQLGISREGAADLGYLDGKIDEIRISDTPRSPEWIKASYESGMDDLLDFGGEEALDISNAPTSKNFGIVSENSSYWSNGSAPDWGDGLNDPECFFTVTNNGSEPVNISIKATDFTGGVGWTLAGSPGVNTVTLKAGKSGDADESDMVILTTSDQSFISGLAASDSIDWELKLETGTFTDGVQKSSTITLTATAS